MVNFLINNEKRHIISREFRAGFAYDLGVWVLCNQVNRARRGRDVSAETFPDADAPFTEGTHKQLGDPPATG